MLGMQRAFGRQFRRPSGLLGRVAAGLMRRGNAPLNLWIVDLLQVGPPDRILEVGFGPGVALGALLARAPAGTGANLPHYAGDHVSELVLLDASPGMLDRAWRKANALGMPITLVEQAAEQLPFEDASFDTVVFTLSLRTIPDPAAALREAHRVLRPGGRLLALEHVRAREPRLATWQDRLTPLWKIVNAGCHPNRDTRASIEQAGFAFESLEELRDRRIPATIVRPELVGTG